MKKTVRICVLHEKREGTSRTTGKPWRSQSAVVGWTETKEDGYQQEQLMAVCFRGRHQEELELKNIQVGQEVELDFDFSTKAFNSGYVSTEITAYFPYLFNINPV